VTAKTFTAKITEVSFNIKFLLDWTGSSSKVQLDDLRSIYGNLRYCVGGTIVFHYNRLTKGD
jgi:hypothetical protein